MIYIIQFCHSERLKGVDLACRQAGESHVTDPENQIFSELRLFI